MCLNKLLLLAEFICSGLLLCLTCNGFVPRTLETTGPDNVRSLFRSSLLQFYELSTTVTRITRVSLKYNLNLCPLLDQNYDEGLNNIILLQKKKEEF